MERSDFLTPPEMDRNSCFAAGFNKDFSAPLRLCAKTACFSCPFLSQHPRAVLPQRRRDEENFLVFPWKRDDSRQAFSTVWKNPLLNGEKGGKSFSGFHALSRPESGNLKAGRFRRDRRALNMVVQDGDLAEKVGDRHSEHAHKKDEVNG